MTAAPVRPGRLCHRLTLQTATTGGDGETVWTSAAMLWAAIDPVGGSERAVAAHVAGLVTHRIRLRARAGVTSAVRFVKGERVFRVLAVRDPGEDGRFLEIDAEEENR